MHYIAHNINKRHQFLTRLVGTKPEENKSLEAVNYLVSVVTATIGAASLLEVVFYFIYNRFVSVFLNVI